MKNFIWIFGFLAAFQAQAQFFPIPDGAIPFGDSRRNLRADSTNLLWNNSSKQIQLGAGTAAAPAFSFAGSGNAGNGMYRSATDEVSFSAAGVQRLVLSSNGRVKVGTSGNVLSNEKFVVLQDHETTSGTVSSGTFQLTTDTASAYTGAAIGVFGRSNRTITTSITDSGEYVGFRADADFVVPAAQTLTNGTTVGYAGFYSAGPSAPTGTLAITNHAGFFVAANSVNTGTNKYGLRIGALSGATNNFAISTAPAAGSTQIGGALATTPGTVSLTADDQAVTVGDRSFIRLSSDNATPANRTFTLSSGIVDGQLLRLHIVLNAAELADSGNVALSAAWTPNVDDVLSLQWDATSAVWREMGRSAN